MNSGCRKEKSSRPFEARLSARFVFFVLILVCVLLTSCNEIGTPKSEPLIAETSPPAKLESGGYKRFNKLIVVWCEPAIQLTRLMLRENLDRASAQRRITAQMPQEEKKAYADFLIDTSPGFPAARQQTNEVFEKLLLLR